MQMHYSGVKVKVLEVEVKPEKWMQPLLFALSDSGRLRCRFTYIILNLKETAGPQRQQQEEECAA